MAKNSLYLIKLKRKSHSEFRHGTSLLLPQPAPVVLGLFSKRREC